MSVRTAVLVTGLAILLGGVVARAEIVTLKNGFQLRGSVAKIASVNENPLTQRKPMGNVDVTQLVLVDDGLRRTIVASKQLQTFPVPDPAPLTETIKFNKPVARSVGKRLAAVGPIIRITPFDEHGNRIFTMQTPDGPTDVIQGITEVHPLYTIVEGLLVRNAIEWDMRVATSSIPRETLSKILSRRLDASDPNARRRLVTFYIQSERYRDALVELEGVIRDFPKLTTLETQRKRLYQLVAEDVIREIQRRRTAGQHRRAYALLSNFPSKDVAGELLIKVSDLLKEYERVQEQGNRALELLGEHVTALKEHKEIDRIRAIYGEIAGDAMAGRAGELDINTLDRMADYLRLADDATLKTEQKLALAITGWLLGSGSGITSLPEALSLCDVRNEVVKYLQADRQVDRDQILGRLQMIEGGNDPARLAQIVRHIKPPLVTQHDPAQPPGFFKLSAPGYGDEADFEYYVQLPPEYHPYRRYPCVVTLNGAGSSPQDQLEWWAGGLNDTTKERVGQAARRGYIVIAPVWSRKNQREYGYSLREHAAVLSTLRDATRRFAIDVDRVFLSGHSMGGDAVWDIGLAHPDLWAGVIPVAAVADKYVSRYWENGRGLPMYFVAGQLDGNKIATNARDLDRYFRYVGFEVIYVEYRGRGHEHFYDEIQRIFDWMELQQREFQPREFEVVSMRPWDNFFWWTEFSGFPERSMVAPIEWGDKRPLVGKSEARVLENNNIYVRSPATTTTVWFSPEFIDFDQQIKVNNDRVPVTPSAEVLLEDVRRRGDRQHPFWARHDVRTSRGR